MDGRREVGNGNRFVFDPGGARNGTLMKSWTTRKGQPHVGQTFDRAGLVRLLTNVLYCGEVRHKGQVYPGERAAIVNRQIWQQAQALLRQTKGGERVRKRPGALLQDLLRCGVCGSRMVAGYSTKKQRRYGYYVCRKAQQQGAASCPGQSIPAARIEGAILAGLDRKSTRLNSSQLVVSYAVFCLEQ